MEKSKKKDIEINNVPFIRNIGIGYDENSFVMIFNKSEDNSYEGAFALEADHLKKLIELLFKAGVQYQKQTKIDIGFDVGENDE